MSGVVAGIVTLILAWILDDGSKATRRISLAPLDFELAPTAPPDTPLAILQAWYAAWHRRMVALDWNLPTHIMLRIAGIGQILFGIVEIAQR
jgi:hypothetical protein